MVMILDNHRCLSSDKPWFIKYTGFLNLKIKKVGVNRKNQLRHCCTAISHRLNIIKECILKF